MSSLQHSGFNTRIISGRRFSVYKNHYMTKLTDAVTSVKPVLCHALESALAEIKCYKSIKWNSMKLIFISFREDSLDQTTHTLSKRTHVCCLQHPTADLRQRFFPFFLFVFGCLQYPTPICDIGHPICDSNFFAREGKNWMTSEFRCTFTKY